jgi:hypothetical protein
LTRRAKPKTLGNWGSVRPARFNGK